MSDSRSGPAPGAPDEEPEGGILGNLPRSRPGVRSPRRTEQPAATGSTGSTEPERPQAATTSGASASDVEALARAGLSLAGGAASLGLRVAGRALAAARDAAERR